MNYTVDILSEAEADLEEAYAWLVERTPQHGPPWYNNLRDAIISLELNPMRCPVVPERSRYYEVRQLLVGDTRHAYRILFNIRGSTVRVMRVLHAARQ